MINKVGIKEVFFITTLLKNNIIKRFMLSTIN